MEGCTESRDAWSSAGRMGNAQRMGAHWWRMREVGGATEGREMCAGWCSSTERWELTGSVQVEFGGRAVRRRDGLKDVELRAGGVWGEVVREIVM